MPALWQLLKLLVKLEPWTGHTLWHCLCGEKYALGDWIYNGEGAENNLAVSLETNQAEKSHLGLRPG